MEGLATEQLTVGYDNDIISGITMNVSPGKIVTLIGPNGSGKSTLLKTVTGQLSPRGGSVYLDGQRRSSMSAKEAARYLSMVTTYSPHPELMTCREVIEGGRYAYTGLFGRLAAEDAAKVDEAIEVTETADVAGRLFTQISDGQRQRVMLARAICQEPQVLVLDEPTSFLDIRYRIDILSKIKKLAKDRNIAILMSLHEPGVAMRISDTVIAVGDGKIMRMGSPKEVFEESFIRQLYGLKDMDTGILEGRAWFDDPTVRTVDPEKGHYAPAVMIQGTMSGVGKSLIAAGLCRIFEQDGYKTAPFKSQNMANNSYVTAEGLEMGRAQVVQAECCKVLPDVRMNPVLLKPTDDKGSQVVVMGKPVGNMSAKDYFEYKSELIPVIREAYESLAGEYDIIVVEGAGSPAEINLKAGDIVNMGLAKMIDAPVLLVGDIDRGGVFAQLIGTLDLLEADERSRVEGLVINKFRGDRSLLENGIEMLEDKAGCRVTGVVPFMHLNIDDEDSLSDRFSRKDAASFDIAVIRLPHIANYTDLDAFEQFDDVSVRYVFRPGQMADADMVIIPGTKNTIADMKWMRDRLLDEAVIDLASKGRVVIGICGGYQMLGDEISDPFESENGGSIRGLGLLPVATVIRKAKTRKTAEGSIEEPSGVLTPLRGIGYSGYEIHMGLTTAKEPLNEFTSNETGYCRGNVYGTYVHGLFDRKEVSAGILKAVADERQKVVDTRSASDMADIKEAQYDMLADTLRASLDIDAIYKMMGIEHDNG